MEAHIRYGAAKRVTLIGAAVNALLALLKIVFGWLGSSAALVADGIHSLSDLLTDALVLFASRFGSRKADWDHPYGHGRIETAATLLLALLLILAGIGILIDAVEHIIHATWHHPKFYVLIIAFLSVIANEALYHYTLLIGKKVKSQLLRANAWHHRSDAASSIVVLIGVAGAIMGFHYFDAVAAFVVGLMVIKMGWSLGWSSVKELVDTGVDAEMLEHIQRTIKNVSGVRAVHQLRNRSMADNILVDVHILVDSDLSVTEGHHIAAQVHNALMQHEHINDVTVHVDPENDETFDASMNLPTRDDLLPQVRQCWQNCEGADSIRKVIFHYFSGKVSIELHLPIQLLDNIDAAERFQQQYNNAIQSFPFITKVELLFG